MVKQFLYFPILLASIAIPAFAMEAPKQEESVVLSLKNLALAQVAQEETIEVLKKSFSCLSHDLAFLLLSDVLAFNFSLTPFQKSELVADFRNREGLTESIHTLLENVERNLLRGGSTDMNDETLLDPVDEESADELSFEFEQEEVAIDSDHSEL